MPSWWSKPRIAAAAAGSCATLLALPLVFVPLDLGRAAALWIAPLPPLAVVMLLGVVFRAPTAWSALAALFLGWGVGLLFALLAPGEWVLAAPPAACAAALVAAAISALLPGPRKSREQLRGLVWGLGQIGQRTPEEASPAIAVPDDDRRWR